MGLLDFFKKKPKAVPEPGTIESYQLADSVGMVRLANGTELRFGRTACKGFEPAVGVKVQVESVEPHPLGGQRAQSIVRDPSDTEYEQRVAARDAQAAPAPPLPPPAPLPTRPIDPDLRRHLSNIASVNAMVRGGQNPEQISLAVNVDAEGRISDGRPTVRFRFDVERLGPDHWRLLAGIDDPTASCRFWLDLLLPELPLIDPATLDPSHAPGFQLRVTKPPEHVRNPMARSAFLLGWRVDGVMEEPGLEGPLDVNVVVMGAELMRLPHVYLITGRPDEHWVLLKCLRGDQGFFMGLDLSTGAAEVFPRRFDTASYQLAMDFLRTFT